MESNQQEEKLNSQDEASVPETVLTEPIQEPQSPEPMEVHHHAHHDHGKKNWKTYFWEFFMLFLAVFCGFLAEIQVEHYIEHQRERKYMQMYVEDLRADSLRFGRVIERNKQMLRNLDQLVSLVNSAVFTDSTIVRMYDLYSRGAGFVNFLYNKRTLSQLRAAGGYKLIRVKEVADSLIARDIDVDWNDWMRQRLHDNFNNVRDNGVEIFDEYQVYSHRKSLSADIDSAIDSVMMPRNAIDPSDAKRFSLLTNDRLLISKFSSSVINFSKVLWRYNRDLISYQRKCHSLIALISKEYAIE